MNSSPQEDSGGNELVVLPGGRLSDREAQIEGGLEANIQASVQQLIESHEHDPPNKMSPEEEARLWAELKTDTGYSSYSAYLRACKEIHLYSKDVDESLWKAAADEHRSLDSSRLPACAVFDLSKGDNSRPELTLHCSSSSGSVILAALHQPLVGKAVRIVLWETSELNTDLVDALGLGLKIHQRFFHVLLPTSASWSHFHVDPDRIKKRPLVPDVVVLENYVVTMAHSNLPVYSDATPVVLIAGKKFGAMSSEAQIDAMLRFRSVTVKNVSESLDKIPAWTKEYVRILQYDLEKGRRSIESDMDLSFRPLAPLQYLHIFTIRRHCSEVREKYKKFIDPSNVLAKRTSLEDLYEMRVGLRRMVEDSEDNSEQLRRFMRSQQTLDVRQERSFITIEDDLKQSRLEARRLETEIRDCLQLQTGELALQESRKSIELSNLQIEEGKRGQFKCLKWWRLLANSPSENL